MTNPTTVHSFPDNRFDEACTKCGGFEGESCEPPKPLLPQPVSEEEMMKKIRRLKDSAKYYETRVAALAVPKDILSTCEFCEVLYKRLSEKQEERNAYRRTLERIRERHSNEATGDGITFYEADKALSLYPL